MVKSIARKWLIAAYLMVGATSSFAASQDTLAMLGNLLTYRGQSLRFWDRAEKWFHALGDPNRITESGKSVTYVWDSLGLQASAIQIADKSAYVSALRVFLVSAASMPASKRKTREERPVPQGGFPGIIILQGVELSRKGARFREIQEKLSGRYAFEARGWPVRSNAGFIAHEPDGFPVGLNTLLLCDEKLGQPVAGSVAAPQKTDPRQIPVDECDYTFDELEIGAPGVTEWQ